LGSDNLTAFTQEHATCRCEWGLGALLAQAIVAFESWLRHATA
jgi:shikimate 5-dehydrogenase